ncbi:MAG: AAA family ATPase [Candidatus Izimaplasma sp.]|nr:AAA family ATPase [Candidatus Izimaplasma bacterium]
MMNRIMVLGPSGTGKTTICRILGNKLGLKVVHLDSIYWKKDWHNIGKEEFDEYMKRFFAENRQWAIDGNYTNNRHFQYRLDLADTIILLDFGLQVSLKGIHERAAKYKHRSRADMAEGCVEGIDQEFLQYTAFYKNKGRYVKAVINQYKNKKQVLIFKSRKEIHKWIATL